MYRERTFSGKKWVPFLKGGEYSPYYGETNLVINWENDGQEIKEWVVSNTEDPTTTHWSRNVRSHSFYFRPGISFLTRTSQRLCSIPLPRGCIFSHVSPAVFVSEDELLGTLIGMIFVLESFFSFFHARDIDDEDETTKYRKKYEVGLAQVIPWAPLDESKYRRIAPALHPLP